MIPKSQKKKKLYTVSKNLNIYLEEFGVYSSANPWINIHKKPTYFKPLGKHESVPTCSATSHKQVCLCV